MAHAVEVGTSGWSYDDWLGPFYPRGTGKGDYLSYYSTRFGHVEVDSTYYRPPSRRMVQGWADKTPESFRFALKLTGSISHEKVLSDCDAEMEEFLAALTPLGPRLLCVLLQFGYFNKATFSSASPFLERLDAILGKYARRVSLAVEIRNRHWLGPRYFDLLRRHGAVAALVEHAWLPPLEQLTVQQDVVTGPFGYVRLIGDRTAIEQITKTWEREVMDRTADLQRVARVLRSLAQRVPVVTYVNNHYAGHGPATAARLRAALDTGAAPA